MTAPLSLASAEPRLSRSITLTQATLYGLGVTIGAGIYVLVGTTVTQAGAQAPFAFMVAAALMALTAASFAELAGRLPVAAGEAAYVRTAFKSNALATAVCLLVAAIAIVSAAAISVGSAGYVANFLALPDRGLIAGVVVAMGAISALGVRESVGFAAAMTVVEIGGLVVIVVAGFLLEPKVIARLPDIVRVEFNPAALAGLVSATLIAVFAFVGFEGLANIAEEVRNPARTLPRAIFLTLLVSTLLYVLVAWIVLASVDRADVVGSAAPLALVFERLTGASSKTISLIAIMATLNGVVVQIIMSSRVLYGVARQGGLPARFATVNRSTRTPLFATGCTIVLVLVLALSLPLEHLAASTSRLTLIVFALVNVSLAIIKWRDGAASADTYIAPTWVPYAGVAACIGLLAADLLFLVAWTD